MFDLDVYIAKRHEELGWSSPFNHDDNKEITNDERNKWIAIINRDYWQEGLNDEYNRQIQFESMIGDN